MMSDPFNWTAAVAAEKERRATEHAARDRLNITPDLRIIPGMAPVGPGPMTPYGPQPPNPVTGGPTTPPAVPAPTTPATPAVPNPTVGSPALGAAVDPAIMANVIAQIQAMIAGLEAQYGAGKTSVNQAYDKYTGDVLTSGRDWMKDLYGRIVDPNDPNAALMQKDPALTNYAQSMSQIEETSGQNRATDLAWFDKTMQNQKDMLGNMAIQLAAQQALGVGGSGGGGGGGGRGRGGGGGGYSRRGGGRRYYSSGGGGGGGDWKDPKTTHTTGLTGTEGGYVTQYGPGWPMISDAIAQSVGLDPTAPDYEQQKAASTDYQDAIAYYLPIFEQKGGTIQATTAETSRKQQENFDLMQNQQIKQAANQAWESLMSPNTQAAVQQLAINDPAIKFPTHNMGVSAVPVEEDGRVTMQPAPFENYIRPVPEGQTTPPVYQPTPEQAPQNDLAKRLLAAEDPAYNASVRVSPMARSGAGASNAGYIPGLINPNADVPSVVNPNQAQIMRDAGQAQWLKAQEGHNKDNPFNVLDYIGTGGFVPGVSQAEIDEAKRVGQLSDWVLRALFTLNPNVQPSPTKYTDTTTATSKVGTTSSTYDPNAAVIGDPENPPTGLQPGVANSPMAPRPAPANDEPLNPATGLPYDPNASASRFDAPDTTEMGGFGEGLRFKVSTQLKNALDKRAAERDAATEREQIAKAAAARAGVLPSKKSSSSSSSSSGGRANTSGRGGSSQRPVYPTRGNQGVLTPPNVGAHIPGPSIQRPVYPTPGNQGVLTPPAVGPPTYRPPIQRRFGGY